jgi:polyhydroxyalkanoic acid synthase PhaR subunit
LTASLKLRLKREVIKLMFMDPSLMGKEYFEQMEKMFTSKLKEALKDPEFLTVMNQGMETGLGSKKNINDSVKNYLKSLNMPTRDDIARVLQYLQAIESKIIGLEEKIEDLEDQLKNKK